MKICIIANGYPTKQDAQFGCFEADQAKALRNAGHDVSIIYVDGRFRTHRRKMGFTFFTDNAINVFGLFLCPLQFILKLNYKLHFKIRCKLLDWVFKYMLKYTQKPDIIYAHYLYNISYATYLRKKYKIPVVGIEHWSVLNADSLSKDVYYKGCIAYNGVDKLLAVSNALSRSINRHFGVETVVVNNMVGNEFLANPNNTNLKNDEIFRFVAIGSLIPRKGYDLLIDAFKKTNLKEKNCELIIIGGGKEQKKLQYQIDSLALTASVSLIGRKNKQEIISNLQESNVFVLSSHVETFSVVCIEAMALGVPVIATSCGGPEEFVSEEVGLLVKPSDMDALAESMNEMYNNYQNYDRENIRNICKCKFAPEVIAKQLSSIFEEVVNKHQSQK